MRDAPSAYSGDSERESLNVHRNIAGLMQLSAAAEAARFMSARTTPLSSPRGAKTALSTTNGASESNFVGQLHSDRDGQSSPPTRVVQLITTAKRPSTSTKETSTNTTTTAATTSTTITSQSSRVDAADAGLPPSWQRVVHESGLPCFVNVDLQVVTWTRPYTLDVVGVDFLTLAKTHVPPLSIFSRRDCGPQPSQPTKPLARRRPVVEEALKAPLADSSNPPGRPVNGQKRRKADHMQPSAAGPIAVVVRRDNVAKIPLVLANGKTMQSPEGRSVHSFLREFATAMWRAVPQYIFTKPDGGEMPIACSIRMNEKQYPTIAGINKAIVKEAAAEAVLEEHIPGYWLELKTQGRVGKYLSTPHTPQTPAESHVKQESKKPSDEKEPAMTMDEFKTLLIGDKRVLQACMDLAIKTPAQVVQEYQNRHRGIAVNYNTVPHDVNGQKMFKVIVTAGSTVAEGVASTKRVAKQYAAQSLLELLHQRTVVLYHEVTELYGRASHQDVSLTQTPFTTQPTDTGASTRSPPAKKARRSSPGHSNGAATGYAQGSAGYAQGNAGYSQSGAGGRAWEGGYADYDGAQCRTWQPGPDGNYAIKNERVVEYYSPNSGGYGGYYGNAADWGYHHPAAAPPVAYAGAYGQPPYGSTAAGAPPTSPPPPPSHSVPYAPPHHAGGPPLSGYPFADPRYPPYNRP